MTRHTQIRHFLLLSSLYLLSSPLQAQTSPTAAQPRGHQPTLAAKADFVAEFDHNGDGVVSYSEFFSSRQQRLAAMDIAGTAQISADGYQAEYADRLDQRLATDRLAQLKQTAVRFAAVDSNQDGQISLAEYQQSGERAFAFIDQNQDGVISQADPAPQPRTARTQNDRATSAPARRPALVMPTTHSVQGMLDMYDLNQDGTVTLAEYQQQRSTVFRRTDRDQNSLLSNSEYMDEFTDRLDQQIANTRDVQLKQALVRFKALDKDGNGILSAPEYHQSGQRMFARWDTDHNRQVSWQEALPRAEPRQPSPADALPAAPARNSNAAATAAQPATTTKTAGNPTAR